MAKANICEEIQSRKFGPYIGLTHPKNEHAAMTSQQYNKRLAACG